MPPLSDVDSNAIYAGKDELNSLLALHTYVPFPYGAFVILVVFPVIKLFGGNSTGTFPEEMFAFELSNEITAFESVNVLLKPDSIFVTLFLFTPEPTTSLYKEVNSVLVRCLSYTYKADTSTFE